MRLKMYDDGMVVEYWNEVQSIEVEPGALRVYWVDREDSVYLVDGKWKGGCATPWEHLEIEQE